MANKQGLPEILTKLISLMEQRLSELKLRSRRKDIENTLKIIPSAHFKRSLKRILFLYLQALMLRQVSPRILKTADHTANALLAAILMILQRKAEEKEIRLARYAQLTRDAEVHSMQGHNLGWLSSAIGDTAFAIANLHRGAHMSGNAATKATSFVACYIKECEAPGDSKIYWNWVADELVLTVIREAIRARSPTSS